MAKSKTKALREGLESSPTHLLHRALQLALDLHGEAAGESAVTQRQFTVLAAASTADGMTQNDLVRATGIDRSTLADLVARMLTKGLLERERSSTDARANTVRLSPSGQIAFATAAEASSRADERLLEMMPAKRRESFVKGLHALAAAADASSGKAAKPPKTSKTEGSRDKPAKKKDKKARKLKDFGA